ncbi:MAG: APC family permease [Planctomycetota bacterium]|nr:APC family permease [Planctomycetota bacterium]
MTPSEQNPGDSLRRELRPLDVTMLVMGGIIGAGIFFTPQKVASLQPSLLGISLAWGIGGVLALTGALVYAELGGLFPRTGGQYVFLREAFGRNVAFFYGWNLLVLVSSGAMAIVCGICVEHLDVVFGHAVGDPTRPYLPLWARVTLSAGLIVALVGLNVRGVRLGANIHNVIMIIKVTCVLFVIVLGVVWWFSPESAAGAGAQAPAKMAEGVQWRALVPAMLAVLFSYGGWESVTSVGGEIRDGGRVLPRAILVGTISVIALYVGINISLVGILGVEDLAGAETPVAAAAGRVLGTGGEILVASMIVVSTLGILHALMIMVPRVFYAMARDGVFFEACGRTHPTRGTPHVAILLFGGFSLLHMVVASFITDIGQLLEAAIFVDWIFFALIGGSYFVFRWRRPDVERPFRAPFHPFAALTFVGLSVAIVLGSLWGLPPERLLIPAVALGSGMLVLVGRHLKKRQSFSHEEDR